MPNWCTTDIVFYSDDKEVINDFHDKLDKWLKDEKSIYPNDFGVDWLGNILCHVFGEKYVENNLGNTDELSFRGSIDCLYDVLSFTKNGKYSFRLSTHTAWKPCINMWNVILEKLYSDKNIGIAYESEEPGCDLYQLHDPDHVIHDTDEVYYVSKFDDLEDILGLSEYNDCDIYTRSELIGLVQYVFNLENIEKELEDIKALNEKIKNCIKAKTGDEYCQFIIGKYEIL